MQTIHLSPEECSQLAARDHHLMRTSAPFDPADLCGGAALMFVDSDGRELSPEEMQAVFRDYSGNENHGTIQ